MIPAGIDALGGAVVEPVAKPSPTSPISQSSIVAATVVTAANTLPPFVESEMALVPIPTPADITKITQLLEWTKLEDGP